MYWLASTAPLEGRVSPDQIAGVVDASIGSCASTLPVVSSKIGCTARARPSASNSSKANPIGLITAPWQPLHVEPGCCVSVSIVWRVVISGESVGRLLVAPGGGGAGGSHRISRRTKTPRNNTLVASGGCR